MTITDFLLYFLFFHEFLKVFCFYDMCHQFFKKSLCQNSDVVLLIKNIKILLQIFFKNCKTKTTKLVYNLP